MCDIILFVVHFVTELLNLLKSINEIIYLFCAHIIVGFNSQWFNRFFFTIHISTHLYIYISLLFVKSL